MITSRFLFIFYTLSFLLPLTNARCYFPDGVTVASFDTPCHTEGDSVCCGQGFACMSNGLCKLTDFVLNAIPGQSKFVRGSCTDPKWGASCPNFCTTPSHGDTDKGAMGLQQCVDNKLDSYFCYDDFVANATSTISASTAASSMLCSKSQYLVVFQGTPTTVTIVGVASTLSSSSSLARTTATATTSSDSIGSAAQQSAESSAASAPVNTSTISQATSSESNLSVAVGAGLGIPLGVIAISLVAFFFWRYQRSKGSGLKAAHSHNPYSVGNGAPVLIYKDTPYTMSSRVLNPEPAEMRGERGSLYELPAYHDR